MMMKRVCLVECIESSNAREEDVAYHVEQHNNTSSLDILLTCLVYVNKPFFLSSICGEDILLM